MWTYVSLEVRVELGKTGNFARMETEKGMRYLVSNYFNDSLITIR